MKKSLLLHALSLKDRMLEPSTLPIHGHVWAYQKSLYSKEEFVGNCITMLSSLGMHHLSIQWKEDILAFDTQWKNDTCTIIISLQDDSLASEFYYFLGIWYQPNIKSPHQTLHHIKPWEDEDLLIPDMSYSISVKNEVISTKELSKHYNSKTFFSDVIYHGALTVYANLSTDNAQSGDFVISPTSDLDKIDHINIEHALYSIRNLMALMTQTISTYTDVFSDKTMIDLEEALQQYPLDKHAKIPLDTLAIDYGNKLLLTYDIMQDIESQQQQIIHIKLLFESIIHELSLSNQTTNYASRSLFKHMSTPFEYASSMLDTKQISTNRLERKIISMQQTLQTFLLAKQLESTHPS